MSVHPVESSQQSVQLPALDAPHAPAAQGGSSEPKPKKDKAKAPASGYALEVRSPGLGSASVQHADLLLADANSYRQSPSSLTIGLKCLRS
jgi:hypothetical protein